MGYYAAAFEPYVGPWVGSQPVLFNAYSLADVTALLSKLKGFKRISTYGQGTFVWQGTPIVQDSNMWNIQAAKANGMKVTAGCYQQGANPGGDSINTAWTQCEIDYAIAQAAIYGNVDELVIGNECIWGPNSAAAITALIGYAKGKISTAGLAIKVSTRQRWDVLAGVNNTTPGYAATRQAILNLLAACDGFVYADVYAYFDPGIAGAIGARPTQAKFSAAVISSLGGSLEALKAAFTGAGVTTKIRVGETGWPTQGSQVAQPSSRLACVKYAKWHYDAVSKYFATAKLKGCVFAGYDEAWKGDQGGTNSEAFFGVWSAQGTAPAVNQYTLTGETKKY
jgi:exo-beta-1,3-glucanase (GH17 family)